MSNLAGALFLTTVTGSIALLIWYFAGRILMRLGYFKWYYTSLWIAAGLFVFPAAYVGTVLMNRTTPRWGGILFVETPAIWEGSLIITVIWGLGAAAMCMRYLFQALELYWLNKGNIPCESWKQELFAEVCGQLGLPVGRVRLWQSYQVNTAVFCGVFCCRVILPVAEFGGEELRIIFLHELTHYRHKDILLKRLVMLAVIINFFNPLAWWLGRLARRWSEYACDQEACEILGSPAAYFKNILNMTERIGPCRQHTAFHLVENTNQLLERVQHMNKWMGMKKRSLGAAAVFSGLLVLLLSTTVLAAADQSARQYEELFEVTDVASEEGSAKAGQELIEYREAGFVSGAVVDEDEDEDADWSIQVMGWNVLEDTMKRTDVFYVSKGSTISVNIYQKNARDCNIKVGIIKPSKVRSYVLGNTQITYNFTAETSGHYRIFIQNDNPVPVEIEGTYHVY